jgi:signal transduction histidine kinase/CheY-like chemotaxis protein
MTDVSCRALEAYFEALRDLGVDLAEFLASVPAVAGRENELSLAWVETPGHRISWNTFARILKSATLRLPAAAINERLAEHFVKGDAIWFVRRTTMLSLLASPRRVYWACAHWVGPFNFSNLKATYRGLPGGRIEIVLGLRDEDEDCLEFFHQAVRGLRVATRLIGLPESLVEAEGDARRMRYLITPPPSATLWARTVRRFRATFAGPALLREMSQQSMDLRDANARLTAIGQQLEAKVTQRTIELEVANGKLQSLIDDLNEAQSIAKVGSLEWLPLTNSYRWSPEVYRILDVSPDVTPSLEAAAQRILPADMQAVAEAVEDARRNFRMFEIEHPIHLPGGEVRHVHLRGEWLAEGQTPNARLIGTIHDITARKRYEASLIEAKTLADQANRLKSTFLANVSHEIRTPMTAILGFAELLGNASLTTEKRQAYSAVIMRNGRHLLAVINDILDLAKAESGHPWVVAGPVTVVPEITQAVDFLRDQAERKGLTVTLSFAPDTPDKIMTDATRLRQIVINVLGNAIKFTDQGGVAVTVGPTDQAHELAIVITDTGCGIKESTIADLFQALVHSSERVRSSPQAGAGLGLALSRSLARALGGDIVLLSTADGEGSSFRITLATKLEVASSAAGIVLPGGATLRLSPSSVLARRVAVQIADVQDGVTVKRALDSLGATVTLFDQSEGTSLLGTSTTPDAPAFDVAVISEDAFGAATGSVVHTLKSKGIARTVIAVAADTESSRTLSAAGCNVVLAKPIDVLTLLRAVAAVVPTV